MEINVQQDMRPLLGLGPGQDGDQHHGAHVARLQQVNHPTPGPLVAHRDQQRRGQRDQHRDLDLGLEAGGLVDVKELGDGRSKVVIEKKRKRRTCSHMEKVRNNITQLIFFFFFFGFKGSLLRSHSFALGQRRRSKVVGDLRNELRRRSGGGLEEVCGRPGGVWEMEMWDCIADV